MYYKKQILKHLNYRTRARTIAAVSPFNFDTASAVVPVGPMYLSVTYFTPLTDRNTRVTAAVTQK